MKSKALPLRCTAAQAQDLALAIEAYAHAAYPPGGSECAQSSNEALRAIAAAIRAEAAAGGAAYKRRQRGMLKAAINWYFGEDGPGDAAKRGPLLGLLDAVAQPPSAASASE